MRNLTVTIAALLGCSMLGGTAVADPASESGLCRKLERHLERCDGGNRLSLETEASCDRIEQGFRDLCGLLETIVATESADSAALDLLRQDFEIVPIEDAVFPYDHVVVGPADLGDPEIADLLRGAHRAGKTVAITDATEDQVRSFHRLIFAGQAADCVSPDRPCPCGRSSSTACSSLPTRPGRAAIACAASIIATRRRIGAGCASASARRSPAR
jgi:hypothetical protein